MRLTFLDAYSCSALRAVCLVRAIADVDEDVSGMRCCDARLSTFLHQCQSCPVTPPGHLSLRQLNKLLLVLFPCLLVAGGFRSLAESHSPSRVLVTRHQKVSSKFSTIRSTRTANSVSYALLTAGFCSLMSSMSLGSIKVDISQVGSPFDLRAPGDTMASLPPSPSHFTYARACNANTAKFRAAQSSQADDLLDQLVSQVTAQQARQLMEKIASIFAKATGPAGTRLGIEDLVTALLDLLPDDDVADVQWRVGMYLNSRLLLAQNQAQQTTKKAETIFDSEGLSCSPNGECSIPKAPKLPSPAAAVASGPPAFEEVPAKPEQVTVARPMSPRSIVRILRRARGVQELDTTSSVQTSDTAFETPKNSHSSATDRWKTDLVRPLSPFSPESDNIINNAQWGAADTEKVGSKHVKFSPRIQFMTVPARATPKPRTSVKAACIGASKDAEYSKHEDPYFKDIGVSLRVPERLRLMGRIVMKDGKTLVLPPRPKSETTVQQSRSSVCSEPLHREVPAMLQ